MISKNVKNAALLFIISAMVCVCGFSSVAQPGMDREIAYQLEVAAEVTSYIDRLFQEFSAGFMSAETALQKLSLWRNEYNKASQPVPDEVKKLHDLVNRLFSQIENYFIYYKRAHRENVNINSKIANLSFEIYKESIRLQQ